MKRKYVPALLVAVIALGFAVFVAAQSSKDDTNTSGIKGVQTSQSTSNTATAKDKGAESPATDTVAVADTTPSDSGQVPADQRGARSGNFMASISHPSSNTGSENSQGNQGGQGGGNGDTAVPTPSNPTPVPEPTPTPPPAATNLIVNPGVEEANAGAPVAWTQGGFGNNTATHSYTTAGHNDSAHGLQVDATAYTDGDVKWQSAEFAVTAGKTYKVTDFYKSSGVSQFDIGYTLNGVPTFAWIGDAAASADWAEFSSQFTVPSGVSSVFVFHALTSVGSLATDDYSFVETGAVTIPPAPQPNPVPPSGVTGGIVSLTFDDGFTSIYANGMPLLKKYGMVSTQYLITDTLLNNANYTEYMTIDQAKDFLVQVPGTEIGSHTVHHCSLVISATTDDATHCPTGQSADQQANQNNTELKQSKADILSIFGITTTEFASPYGAYDAPALAQIKDAGYASHRSTDAGFNSPATFNPYNILVQNVEAATTPAQVLTWVNQAKATNTWLVLVYHTVDTSGDAYGVTPANLEQELIDIKNSGIKVETVSQGRAAMTAQ